MTGPDAGSPAPVGEAGAAGAVDPVLLSVVNQALTAAAEEMSRNLVRSAYSTIVREARDAATALLTPAGTLVAQGERTIPVLLNAFPPVMAGFRARGLLDGIQPGDALVTNDPYAGGQHLDDVVLVTPVFAADRLIGWAGSLAHQIDIGAGAPGIHPTARSVFDEGLRIPPLRIRLDTDLRPGGLLAELLRANIRLPEQTLGDLRAQVAAVRTGEQRLRELACRHGTGVLLAAMDALVDYAETMTRETVRGFPDGRYAAVDWVDDDGYTGVPLRVAVTVEVAGDRMHVDLSGTAEQAAGPVNAPLASTLSAVHTAVKFLLPPQVPANEGCTRPVTVTVPPGSLLNPEFPAPVGARMGAVFKVVDAIFGALAGVLPDRVIAGSYSAVAAVALSEQRPGAPRLYREALGGGYGAGAGYPGASGVAVTLTNTANTPVEFTELHHPYFLVEGYALRPGSGGVGRFAGGAGVEKRYRILADGVLFTAYSDRHRAGAPGRHGGQPGAPAAILLDRAGTVSELPSKVSTMLRAGDLISIRTGGGGGWGRPDPP